MSTEAAAGSDVEDVEDVEDVDDGDDVVEGCVVDGVLEQDKLNNNSSVTC